MKKKIAVLGSFAVSLLAPVVAFAQDIASQCAVIGNGGNLQGVICTIYKLIRIAIPVLILGAVAWFIWGVIQFVIAGDGEEKAQGRSTMIHGIIGFAVILGLWGLVYILLGTFGVSSGGVDTGGFPTF